MKKCSKCKMKKPYSLFKKRGGKESGYRSHCTVCLNDKASLDMHRRALKNKYGITEEDYDNFYVEQNGCCAICNKHQSKINRRLSVDHNHKTGKVRGLLCDNCNCGIGNLKDKVSNLESAIIYLTERGSYGE